MNTSDTLRCAILCLQKQEVGCCYLGNEAGCYWYAGGLAGAQNGDNGAMAVTCNSGKSQIILLLSLGYKKSEMGNIYEYSLLLTLCIWNRFIL